MGFSTTVLTADWLKAAYLHGISLTDDDGNPFPDEVWELALASAEDWIKSELAIEYPRRNNVVERHDFTRANLSAFSFISLDRRPVRRINSVKMKYGTFQIFEVPETWLIEGDDGIQLQVLPAGGLPVAAPLELIGFASYWMATLGQNIPGFFVVDYDAGYDAIVPTGGSFPSDYDPLPADILDLMGKKAACGPLDIAGDLVVGMGLASWSVSADGISMSKNSTASPTNSGFGARIIQYRKYIKEQLPNIRRRYHGMLLGVA